jgi:hypothetical protein
MNSLHHISGCDPGTIKRFQHCKSVRRTLGYRTMTGSAYKPGQAITAVTKRPEQRAFKLCIGYLSLFVSKRLRRYYGPQNARMSVTGLWPCLSRRVPARIPA